MTKTPRPTDPVLSRLQDALKESGMSKAALAARLGVSRATAAGWFAGLGGDEKPSARRFSFPQQPHHVQEAIALFLRTSVTELMHASTDAGDASTRLGPEELMRDTAVATLAAGLGLDDPAPPHQRLASLVMRVPEVSGVHLVERVRGRRFPLRYGHYIVVLAEVADGSAELPADMRTRIERYVAELRIPWSWEHGGLAPAIRVVDRDGGTASIPVGSMISQAFSGTRFPRSPWLIPPLHTSNSDSRFAVVLTNPFGGGAPIAGCWAETFGVGHLRDRDVIRLHWDIQAQRGKDVPERGALLPREKTLDSAYVVHQTLDLLQSAVKAGAWVMSVEGALLDHAPLLDALVRLPDPLVVVRLGSQWRRLAAWRLAAADRAQRNLGGVVDYGRDGASLTREETESLSEHTASAMDWLRELERWEGLLDEVISLRDATRPTVSHTLEELPEGLEWWTVRQGRWERRVGRFPDDGPVVVPDDVDGFQDSWTAAAGAMLADLIRTFGYTQMEDRRLLTDRVQFDPMRRLLTGEEV